MMRELLTLFFSWYRATHWIMNIESNYEKDNTCQYEHYYFFCVKRTEKLRLYSCHVSMESILWPSSTLSSAANASLRLGFLALCQLWAFVSLQAALALLASKQAQGLNRARNTLYGASLQRVIQSNIAQCLVLDQPPHRAIWLLSLLLEKAVVLPQYQGLSRTWGFLLQFEEKAVWRYKSLYQAKGHQIDPSHAQYRLGASIAFCKQICLKKRSGG